MSRRFSIITNKFRTEENVSKIPVRFQVNNETKEILVEPWETLLEALRDKQLDEFLKQKEKLSNLSSQKDDEKINELASKIIKFGGKPNIDNEDQKRNVNKSMKESKTQKMKKTQFAKI